MKNVLINMILCLGLISCVNNEEHPINTVPPPELPVIIHSPKVEPPAIQAVVPKDLTVSGTNWSLVVPSTWQKVSFEDEPTVKAAYADLPNKNLVILMQEPYQGDLDAYANLSANEIVQEGGKLMSAKKLVINEVDFYQLVAVRDVSTVWNWVAVKDNLAYGLSCGGPTFDIHNQEVCGSIANSLVIK